MNSREYSTPMPAKGTIHLLLGRGRYAVIDADMKHLVQGYTWTIGAGGYVITSDYDYAMPTIYLHRLLLPGHPIVDHRDGNRLNNRLSNLRPATPAENARNSKRNRANTSGYRGVSWSESSGRWQARITVDRKQIHLGTFSDKVSAARAYDAAASRHHGEFARLNFPALEVA